MGLLLIKLAILKAECNRISLFINKCNEVHQSLLFSEFYFPKKKVIFFTHFSVAVLLPHTKGTSIRNYVLIFWRKTWVNCNNLYIWLIRNLIIIETKNLYLFSLLSISISIRYKKSTYFFGYQFIYSTLFVGKLPVFKLYCSKV